MDRLASHSITHRLLRDLEYEQKKVEISDSKNKIEHVAGIEVSGFRAPSYSIDHEVIQLLGEENTDTIHLYSPILLIENNLGLIEFFQIPLLFCPNTTFLNSQCLQLLPAGFVFIPLMLLCCQNIGIILL